MKKKMHMKKKRKNHRIEQYVTIYVIFKKRLITVKMDYLNIKIQNQNAKYLKMQREKD